MDKLFSHIFIQTSFSLVPSSSVSISQNYSLRIEGWNSVLRLKGGGGVKKKKVSKASRTQTQYVKKKCWDYCLCRYIRVKEVGTVLGWLIHLKAVKTEVACNLYKSISYKKSFSSSQTFSFCKIKVFFKAIHAHANDQ